MAAPVDNIPHFGYEWPLLKGGYPVPLITRHFKLAYDNKGKGSFYHRKEAIKLLWPKYEWHRWNERMLRGICDYDWVTWLAPAASGKSTAAAVFANQLWLEAPDRTAVIVCSTTMQMLRKRIWNEIAAYHSRLPKNMGNMGELIDSKTLIRWQQGDDKHGIFGIAVEEGPIDEVVNNLIGIHAENVFLFLDEAQGVREAIMAATNNMSKNPKFKCLLMGNPTDLNNPLCRESEPLGGWETVTRGETEEWETLGGPVKGRGLAQFFDGRKSPANDSPEERKRLRWLINSDWIEAHLKSLRGNANDPTFWSQSIGWPPAMGLESTVLDDSIVTTFRVKQRAVWTNGFVNCASLDPAFNGGDDAIFRLLKRGEVTDDSGTRWVIEFGEWMKVPIDAESSIPIHYQIVYFVKGKCEQIRIPPEEFALDSSGEGGGLAAIFRQEWGPIVEIESGGSPSDLPINDAGKTAKEAYDTRSSELCFSVREFALSNGIRGLDDAATKQGCDRRTFYRNGKWCVEPKRGSKGRTDEKGRPVKGFKERLGYSPDHWDAAAVGVEHCRQKGAVPFVKVVADPEERQAVLSNGDEYSSDNYLEGYDFSND